MRPVRPMAGQQKDLEREEEEPEEKVATKSVVSDFNAAEEREERRGCCIISWPRGSEHKEVREKVV